jgi:hypothetical protein
MFGSFIFLQRHQACGDAGRVVRRVARVAAAHEKARIEEAGTKRGGGREWLGAHTEAASYCVLSKARIALANHVACIEEGDVSGWVRGEASGPYSMACVQRRRVEQGQNSAFKCYF